MNLLKLLAFGQPGTNDPMKVENAVTAGLDEIAHVANPDHGVQTIIDAGQQLQHQDLGTELQVAVAKVPTSVSSAVGHTWTTTHTAVTPLEHVHIPWLGS